MIRYYAFLFVFVNVVFMVEAVKNTRKNNGINGNGGRNKNGNGNGNSNGNKNGNSNGNGNEGHHGLPPMLPNTYKDVFVHTPGNKKTLGTTKATCWARGGLCMEIRDCPHLNIDISVPGCAWGYKVCCKINKLGTPTLAQHRKRRYPKAIERLEDLGGVSVETLAERNTKLLKAVLEFKI